MPYPTNINEQRREQRFNLELPAQISVGSQLIINGKLKNISLKSAFLAIKTDSVYLKTNDEIGFMIEDPLKNGGGNIEGLACISRIEIGAGLAIYFTQIDKKSENLLKEILNQQGASNANYL